MAKPVPSEVDRGERPRRRSPIKNVEWNPEARLVSQIGLSPQRRAFRPSLFNHLEPELAFSRTFD